MPKKEKSPGKNPLESVQFRPGPKLGELIDELAGIWGTSRGETAKRLAALSAHQLELALAPLAVELSECLYRGEDYVDACHMIFVMLREAETEGALAPDAGRDQKVALIKKRIDQYRSLRGLQRETEQERVQIKIVRNADD